MAASPPTSPTVLALAFLVVALLILGAVYLWLRPDPRTMLIWGFAAVFGSGFMWLLSRGPAQQAAFTDTMIREGLKAVATVQRVESTGVRYGSRPQVRLTLMAVPPGQPGREMVVTEVLPMGIAAQPGQRLWIYLDPADGDRWWIDWSAAPPEAAAHGVNGLPTVSQRLENLQTLRDRGLISEEEFASQRQRILAEL